MSSGARASTLGRLALAAGLASMLACHDDKVPDAALADERTLAKLKAEQEQHPDTAMAPAARHAGPPVEDPNAELANRASAAEAAPRPLPVPEKAVPVQVGPLTARLLSLERSTTVGDARVKLTSDQAFLTVKLSLSNAAARSNVDLGFLRVTDGAGGSFEIARDAQHVGGTRVIAFHLEPQQQVEVALIFEVAPQRPKPGWLLVLPAATVSGGNQDVTIPLG